jgi:predicted transposase YbfD/YdcC
VCELITKKKAAYLFSLKNNHRAKVKELALQFTLKPLKGYSTVDKGHGRVEERILKVMDMPAHLKEWAGVKQALKLTRKRYCKGKESVEVVYAITSLCSEKADPKRLMQLWRDHWGIENGLHRTRDMAFDEDRSTVRKGNSTQIMAALRNTAIQITRKLNLSIALATHIGSRFPKRIIKFLNEN